MRSEKEILKEIAKVRQQRKDLFREQNNLEVELEMKRAANAVQLILEMADELKTLIFTDYNNIEVEFDDYIITTKVKDGYAIKIDGKYAGEYMVIDADGEIVPAEKIIKDNYLVIEFLESIHQRGLDL